MEPSLKNPILKSRKDFVDEMLRILRGEDKKFEKWRSSAIKKFVQNVDKMFDELASKEIKRYYRDIEEFFRLHSVKGAELCRCVDAIVKPRLFIGTAIERMKHILEIGIDLDPILCVPVIRASALKGCIRSYIETVVKTRSAQIAKALGLKSVEDAKRFLREVFGVKAGEGGEVGQAIFFDAYPIKKAEVNVIEQQVRGRRRQEHYKVYLGYGVVIPEVITPTYRGSAEEHKARPTPLPTLAVPEGTVFRICYMINIYRVESVQEAVRKLQVLDKLVQQALEESGVGAKTSSGYSRLWVKV